MSIERQTHLPDNEKQMTMSSEIQIDRHIYLTVRDKHIY